MSFPITFFYKLVNSRSAEEFEEILNDARPSEITELEDILRPFDKLVRHFKPRESDPRGLLRLLAGDCENSRRHLARALYEYFKKQYRRSFYDELLQT